MKNPKLIVKPFAKNGQKNVIPENYETSMDSNQATWDQGFGQITMLPVAAGGLPPKGQDFNGILNQISENIVYQSQGGRFKFSPEYAESIGGYPKGAILQSDDEKKEYQSLIDNNKVNFNTTSNISASWELVGYKYAIKTEVDLALTKKFDKENISSILGNDNSKVPSLGLLTTEVGKLQPKGNYQPAGDYATNTALSNGLSGKLDKTGGTATGAILVKSSNEAISIQCVNEEIASYSIKNSNGSLAAYFGYGSAASPSKLQIINSRSNTSVTIDEGRITVNGKELMDVGSYGFGGRGVTLSTANDTEVLSLLRNVDTPSQILSSREVASQYFPGNYSASLYARGNDSFTLFAASCFSDDVIVTAGNNAGTRLKVLKLLTSQNLAQELGSSSTVAISQKAVSDSLFGRSKYIDVTSQRSSGVTYTNTTKTPRFISVIITGNVMNPQINFIVDGVQTAFFYNSAGEAKTGGVCIIPAGSTYSFTANASVKVMELN